jgi:hypothetical protein
MENKNYLHFFGRMVSVCFYIPVSNVACRDQIEYMANCESCGRIFWCDGLFMVHHFLGRKEQKGEITCVRCLPQKLMSSQAVCLKPQVHAQMECLRQVASEQRSVEQSVV